MSDRMGKYNLVAFDMDGTLLDSEKRITQESQNAIKTAVEQGKYVALSTGRGPRELDDYDEDLKNVPFIICTSGALVIDNRTKERIFQKTIPRETVLKIFDISAKYSPMWHIHSELSVVQRNQGTNLEVYQLGYYQGIFNKYSYFVEDIRKWYEENDIPVYKFNCYCRDTIAREKLFAQVKDLPVSLSYSEVTALEFSPKDVSKASGLRQLCNHLGIGMDSTIAVGDSENDLTIIEAAGLGVAMGNARQQVKDASDVVVRDNDHEGCAQVIKDYLLK